MQLWSSVRQVLVGIASYAYDVADTPLAQRPEKGEPAGVGLDANHVESKQTEAFSKTIRKE